MENLESEVVDIYKLKPVKIAEARVDKADSALLKKYKWRISGYGYAETTIKRKKVFMHHMIIGKKDGYVVDHINGDRLDNRRKNLRHITRSLNAFNRKGVKGIYKIGKKWKAQICCNGNVIKLGYFNNKQNAIKARRHAEIKYFGENNTI